MNNKNTNKSLKKENETIDSLKLREYMTLLEEFNSRIGSIRGTPKRISKITSYLIIYGKLSQKQLAQLTGYSISNISMTLNLLSSIGLVKKQRIPKSHEYEFFIKNNISDSNRFQIKQVLYKLSQLQEGFSNLICQLNQSLNSIKNYDEINSKLINKEKKPDEQRKQHIHPKDFQLENGKNNSEEKTEKLLIKQTIERMKYQINYIQSDVKQYSLMLKQFYSLLETRSKNHNSINSGEDSNRIKDSLKAAQISNKFAENYKKKMSFESYHPLYFNSELLEIEQIFISLIKEYLIPNEDNLESAILPYFFTRGMLTQKIIKKITNFSTGGISKTIKILKEKKIIEESPIFKDSRGKQLPTIYRLSSVTNAAANKFIQFSKIMKDYQSDIQNAVKDLKQNKQKFEDNNIYRNILTFFEDVLSQIPHYSYFSSSLMNL